MASAGAWAGHSDARWDAQPDRPAPGGHRRTARPVNTLLAVTRTAPRVLTGLDLLFGLLRLRATVETVRDGAPLFGANAARQRRIAGAVLALEGLHVAVGVSTERAPPDIEWSFSPTPWRAVLPLFVLVARVFEQATRMRDDSERAV